MKSLFSRALGHENARSSSLSETGLRKFVLLSDCFQIGVVVFKLTFHIA